jgi:hypothetical protein
MCAPALHTPDWVRCLLLIRHRSSSRAPASRPPRLVPSAQALPPDGRLVALERDERPLEMARRFWSLAGVADRVELRVGPALQSLEQLLARDGPDSYDMAFVGRYGTRGAGAGAVRGLSGAGHAACRVSSLQGKYRYPEL